jgi:hypothetical protein
MDLLIALAASWRVLASRPVNQRSAPPLPRQDDPESPDYNVHERVDAFVEQARQHASITRGNDIIFLEGSDFTFSNADTWFVNLDRLIKAVNQVRLPIALPFG